jgi:DNA polymerase-1
MKSNRTALVDGDYFAYSVAVAHDEDDYIEFHDRLTMEVRKAVKAAFCSDFLICLSCPREENFRRDHYPAYKAFRDDKPAPALLGDAKEILGKMGPVRELPRMEADDVMGILATDGTIESPVIVSIDKDMRQVPGLHFNPRTDDFPVRVTEEEGYRLLLLQWLKGDPSDGYPGIYGVGEKKAAKWLDTHGWTWGAVLEMYRQREMSVEYALSQYHCARILQAGDRIGELRV